MAVVKNLMIRAGADFSSMRKEMNRANKNLSDFKSKVTRTMSGISVALTSLGIGVAIKNATKEAMQFEASLQQIERQMGSSAESFRQWAKEGAGAFNLARIDAVKYGAVFGNLISSFTAGTEQTAEYTQKLLKTSAVVASATGRTMTDTLDRIRSGLLGNTEAIEDLGINVNVAMIESTKAFKRFANGRSWRQLDFQTQQQIRLFAILEQAATKYGTELAKNTNTAQGKFVAQLKNAQLALGQAFLPIYNIVLPALTSLAKSLASTLQTVAAFSRALFGGDQEQQTKSTEAQANAVSGLGDAYEKAGKQAKGSVAGFDRVNLLGGMGGILGGGVSSIVADAMSNQLQGVNSLGEKASGASKKIQEFAEQIKNLISAEEKKRITDALSDLGTSFDTLKASISDFLKNESVGKVAEFIKSMSATRISASIMQLSGAFEILSGQIKGVDGILSGDFEKSFSGAEQVVSGFYDTVNGFAYLVSTKLGDSMAEFKKDFSEKWKSLKNDIKKYGDPAKLEAADFGKYIRDKVSEKWDELKKATSTKWGEIKDSLSGIWTKVKDQINWSAVKDTLNTKWDELKAATSSTWNDMKNTLGSAWDDIKNIDWSYPYDRLSGFWSDLKTNTRTKWDEIKTALGNVWDGIKIKSDNIWDDITGGVKSSINTIIDAINTMIRGLNRFSIDIPDWVALLAGVKGGTFGINIPMIPKLATGGLAFGPTLATVGDNRNAAIDPEVIAPLSKLEAMMGNDNKEVVSVLRDILQAIRNSGSGDNVSLSKTALGRAASSAINDLQRRTGQTTVNV